MVDMSNSMPDLLGQLGLWHWLGLAIALLVIEMMTGTFDLLWVAVAAAMTCLFAGLAPDMWTDWPYQVGFFSIVAIALVFIGRTLFAGMLHPATSHPELNNRSLQMVGKRAVVASAFKAGIGTVKVGDSIWRAEGENGLEVGQEVEIIRSAGSTVTVQAV